MPHSLRDMIGEAAKIHARHLEHLIDAVGVCQRCRISPIGVIARPPTFEVALIDDPVVASIGYPCRNPYSDSRQDRLRITEVVQLLCESCAGVSGEVVT